MRARQAHTGFTVAQQSKRERQCRIDIPKSDTPQRPIGTLRRITRQRTRPRGRLRQQFAQIEQSGAQGLGLQGAVFFPQPNASGTRDRRKPQ